MTLSVHSFVDKTRLPGSTRSAVKKPSSNTVLTASSIADASVSRLNEYFNIIATDRIAAAGFAKPSPAISGAEPWTGSYNPKPSERILADGSTPSDPVITDASSLRMSPNIFSVTTTSNAAGFVINFIAVESTNICSTSISGYAFFFSSTTSRHSLLVSSTFALSTEATFPLRKRAISNALTTIRSISSRV